MSEKCKVTVTIEGPHADQLADWLSDQFRELQDRGLLLEGQDYNPTQDGVKVSIKAEDDSF